MSIRRKMHKLPSFNFLSGSSSRDSLAGDGEENGGERKSRGLFRRKSRSPSPYAGRKSRSPSTDRERDGAASDYASDGGESVDYASSTERLGSSRGNAYLTDESSDPGSEGEPASDEEDEDDIDDLDPEVQANTEANAGSRTTPADYLLAQPALLGNPDDEAAADGPNLIRLAASPFASTSSSKAPSTSTSAAPSPTPGSAPSISTSAGIPIARRQRRKSTLKNELRLQSGRPIYERNRCTITLTHGDPDGHVENDASRKARKKKTYVVASDLSEESYYAIEWAIGTVLRNGDELLYVTVMETDSKRMSPTD